MSAVLREGVTCWRLVHAERMAVIIDGAAYFRALKQAILAARHSVLMVGWDFHTGILLERDGVVMEGVPNRLGDFLSFVVRENPGLDVHILRWDLSVLKMPLRGTSPALLFHWLLARRIHFKLDSNHPTGACHHQKIVVIDDRLAFCGGIDCTVGRWDTGDHVDDDPRRDEPDGQRHKPWHDVTTAVDGDAARALGDLARMRWKAATGETIAPPPERADVPWPDSLDPRFTDVKVGIARTWPKTEQMPETREIEALYLAAIASARHTIYLESQYFASPRIAEAIGARLAEAEGPEVLIVNPRRADGWLEEEAMGSARALLLRDLHRLDHGGRLRFATPVSAGEADIYVHAKVLIIDDTLLRVGSSNVNNRSMGIDTESDLAVEVGPDDARADIRAAILDVRDALIAEHIGVTVAAVRQGIEEHGSLVRAFDALNPGTGRRLAPFAPPSVNDVEAKLAESAALDPDRVEAMAPNFLRALRLINKPRPRHLLRGLTHRAKTA
ncbi:phospholipase D-like domain-containing protein [Acidiphilium acidophilum]|uniref:phospholipase D-like domain-containing protein n=1 Tax=Acidiphilium acidophilum TaxID=76588 RepID=UPI002E8E6423|nr:phospholipase D-like domain-containing protein [Acidiphilium acidophilum]